MFAKLTIVGRLGQNPEMRYMPDGTAVTNFSVATSRSWTDRNSGEKVEETTWFRVAVWGNQAEAANQYLNRGSKVFIEGQLVPDAQTGGPRIWERRDGTAGASFEVKANRVLFLDSRSTANGSMEATAPTQEEMDEIPF